VATALLEATVAHAVARGARAVEAYPLSKPDYMGDERRLTEVGFAARRRQASEQ